MALIDPSAIEKLRSARVDELMDGYDEHIRTSRGKIQADLTTSCTTGLTTAISWASGYDKSVFIMT